MMHMTKVMMIGPVVRLLTWTVSDDDDGDDDDDDVDDDDCALDDGDYDD